MKDRNNYYNDPLLKEVASCQRNFDRSKPISEDIIAQLDEWVAKGPQQVGERVFNTIKITNPDCALHLSQICSGVPEDQELQKDNVYQPQANATLTYVWCLPGVTWFAENDHILGADPESYRLHIGFNAGLVTRKATDLGLKTGFTACGPHTREKWEHWKQTWGLNKHKYWDFQFALGVGYGYPGMPYFWSPGDGFHTHMKPTFLEIDEV